MDSPLTYDVLLTMDGCPVWCAEERSYGLISVVPNGRWANVPFFVKTENSVIFQLDIVSRGLTIYRYGEKEQ